MKKIVYLLSIVILAVGMSACEKSLEFDQDGSLKTDEAIQTPEDLQAVLNGIYDVFANTMNGNFQNFNELLSNNVNRPKTSEFYTEIWLHNTNFFNATIRDSYANAYRVIERANVLLINVDKVPSLSAADRQRMVAEAHFMRAYMHFELVRLFAQPYGYSPNNTHLGIVIRQAGVYELAPRATVGEVYDFIISDLEKAHAELPDNNGAFANRFAAAALLSKVHFQTMNYTKALPYLNEVIDQGGYTLTPGVDRFVEDQIISESIFGVVSTLSLGDDRSGPFKNNYTANEPELSITPEMISETFVVLPDTTIDLRAKWFTLSNAGQPNERYILNKYPLKAFNIPLLYLTDMKLLRAEALALTNGDLNQAASDINDIRFRAGYNVSVPPNSTAEDVLQAVYRERQIEMSGEGDWIQHLKRRGAAGENITIRGAEWNCPGMILQFPSTENSQIFVMNEEGGC